MQNTILAQLQRLSVRQERNVSSAYGGRGLVLLLSAAALQLTVTSPRTAVAGALDPATLPAAINTYNSHQRVKLPVPSGDELRALADGLVVKRRERRRMSDARGEEQDRIRIVGYRVYELPRVLVWLAALDFTTQHSKRLTEHLIESDDEGGARWYQYLWLPWPIRDRHWVISTWKDLEVSSATAGFVWEHAWRLDDAGEATAFELLASGAVDGVTERHGAKAKYVPVNRGGWTMFELDERRVLVVAHVTSVLGGWIPDGLVARFVSAQLDSLLTNLEQKASTVHARYDASYPILTGDGELITPEAARAACFTAADRSNDC